MGDDDAVVEAARVSYGRGTRSVRDNTALIRYLLANGHTSPFEMAELKLHIKLPIFVARQWIRHRTASVNEYSARYSVLDKEYYVPDADAVAAQSTSNRQGRGHALPSDAADRVISIMREGADRSYAEYESLLTGRGGAEGEEVGVARELARAVLPVSYYTQWFWKTDLHNLLHFLNLRMDAHAQWEIRKYATVIGDLVAQWVPITWQAFRDYRLDAASLSAPALMVVKRWLAGETVDEEGSGLSSREWQELQERFGR